MWAEWNGAGVGRTKPPKCRPRELQQQLNEEVLMTHGIVVSDSKGGYDAIEANESAGLGMKCCRAAVEALALKDIFVSEMTKLIWVASDWNLGDAFTKMNADARDGLLTFLATRRWRLKFDPTFVVSTKKQGKTAVPTVLAESPSQVCVAIESGEPYMVLGF